MIRRFESVNLFISFLNDSIKEKEYLMNVSSYKSILEIHDLENDKYNITEAIEFFDNFLGIYSFIFQILETTIDNENKYFFIYISTFEKDKYCIEIKKFGFLNFNFEYILEMKKTQIELNRKPRITSSIIIDNYNLLVLFFMNYNDNSFYSYIYDYELKKIGEKYSKIFSSK